MKRFKNILFVPCGAPANRLALRQAVQLTRENEACLRVLITARHVPDGWEFATVVERNLREQTEEDLYSIIAESGVDIALSEIEVDYIQGEPFLEIIRAVLAHKHDLVIKAAEDEYLGERPGFSTTDMHLLRKCPCPLWLFRPHKNADDALRLMAAIDPDPRNLANPTLTNTILELGTSLKQRLPEATLDVIYAWEYEYENTLRNSPFIRIDQKKLDAEIARTRAQRSADFNAALEHISCGAEQAIKPRLEKGNPIEVVPEVVRNAEIDLLIMGTLARSGIEGLLIGNTAESILLRVDCSVMAIKPTGFKTPVTL
jgi:nucleotide-binding universal stress UspA family protein